MTIRIALVGFGKIARDEHLPAIRAHGGYDLVALVSQGGVAEAECPIYPTLTDLLADMAGGVDAVAICTPPKPRFALASEAISAGLAVLLEKPPAATLGELDQLVAFSQQHQTILYSAWHSQHAAGVDLARRALAGEKMASLHMVWHEDVRKFHADQQWIWQPGGFGVFDPGINGLSILTRILDDPLSVRSARLLYPGNQQAPIAAQLEFDGAGMTADLDWRGTDQEEWAIRIETTSGKMIELTEGGACLSIDDISQSLSEHAEYRSIYREFASSVAARASYMDREPLRIVADAFLIGSRIIVEDFV